MTDASRADAWTRNAAVVLARAALAYAPDFNGRATRTELAITGIACLAAGAVLVVLGSFGSPGMIAIQAVLSGLLVGLPLIAVVVRRLHDTNRRWFAIFTLFWPYVGIVLLGIYLLKDGHPGDNECGPDPRERRGL